MARSGQSNKAENCNDDNDSSDNVDDLVHGSYLVMWQYFSRALSVRNDSNLISITKWLAGGSESTHAMIARHRDDPAQLRAMWFLLILPSLFRSPPRSSGLGKKMAQAAGALPSLLHGWPITS